MSLALLAAQACVGVGRRTAATLVIAAALLAVAVVALRLTRAGASRDGSAVPTLTALLGVLSLAPLPWQLVMGCALGLLALLGRSGVVERPAWPPLGRPMLGWAAVVGGVTPLALVGWLRLAHPDLSDVRALVPAAPFALLVAGGAAFALVNAALEEAIWRGLLQSALTRTFGTRWAVALQAISFGLQHAHGIPRGVMGIVLAGAWALMLGALRSRSGGLLAPTVAHVVADATIAVIVLSNAT